jgi:hypothetical protein
MPSGVMTSLLTVMHSQLSMKNNRDVLLAKFVNIKKKQEISLVKFPSHDYFMSENRGKYHITWLSSQRGAFFKDFFNLRISYLTVTCHPQFSIVYTWPFLI